MSGVALCRDACTLQQILDGSAEGKIKVAAERSTLAAALGALAEVPTAVYGEKDLVALAEETTAFLAAAIKEEREWEHGAPVVPAPCTLQISYE